ncbi:uncharacterized protein AC631_00478 [Debaryomyces fabryi]|uniref:Dipeptidase n=1 Tax=Debaryomyces fabryi TaxID=58627 RepID=A0A0V1Q5U6_9ASCO|nr:uncharacterized protein AC631_00478 [Debaryomyces fabryi]KSA03843.1 hypothetical protein AC631_00478 [Debaryomyces fabryi]CUM45363.1 unnamed protein product [Debaryomyces fabryi]
MVEKNTDENFIERFKKISRETPVVDTHNDFPYLLRVQLHNEFETESRFNFDDKLQSHTDLMKFRQGKIGLQFFSCFIECKDDDYLYQDFNKANSAVRDTMEQIDVVTRLVDSYLDDMKMVLTSLQVMDVYSGGKVAITMGVEGLHQVDSSLSVLRKYYELGVRYITLTHNCDNPFATAASSVVAGLPDKGLSDFGRSCIQEMNRIGMMVDLSHVSYKTMLDVLEITKAPVMFSHSSAYSITPNERNVRDDVLLKMKENGGVICINFFPLFISQTGDECATIDDAVDHIKHVVELIGWEHVGLGSDFDGIPEGPKGLEDVSKYPDLLIKVMEKLNASDSEIQLLMGKNVLRVWNDNERVSRLLQKAGTQAVNANWPERDWSFYDYAKTFPEIFPGAYQAKKNTYKDSQSLDLTTKK